MKSDSFPVHWNGEGKALDLAKTPGRIGLQLKMNSKNSLVHFQESGWQADDRQMARKESNGFMVFIRSVRFMASWSQTLCLRSSCCQESEVDALDPPRLKMEIADRVGAASWENTQADMFCTAYSQGYTA